MSPHDAIFPSVPIGEANAMTSRQIWEIVGMWAEVTISRRLVEMEYVGVIKRRARQISGAGFAWVYWREEA